MPIYEYLCPECRCTTEEWCQFIKDKKPTVECQWCGVTALPTLSKIRIRVKGVANKTVKPKMETKHFFDGTPLEGHDGFNDQYESWEHHKQATGKPDKQYIDMTKV